MNKCNREQILFDSLKYKNDDVKLAICLCLDTVPVDEIDSEELTLLLKVLETYKVIGTGKTEEVRDYGGIIVIRRILKKIKYFKLTLLCH